MLKLSFERRINELKKIIILSNFESRFILKKTKKFLELSLDCKFDSNDFLALCKLEREINDVSFERRIKYLIRKRKDQKIKFFESPEQKSKTKNS